MVLTSFNTGPIQWRDACTFSVFGMIIHFTVPSLISGWWSTFVINCASWNPHACFQISYTIVSLYAGLHACHLAPFCGVPHLPLFWHTRCDDFTHVRVQIHQQHSSGSMWAIPIILLCNIANNLEDFSEVLNMVHCPGSNSLTWQTSLLVF